MEPSSGVRADRPPCVSVLARTRLSDRLAGRGLAAGRSGVAEASNGNVADLAKNSHRLYSGGGKMGRPRHACAKEERRRQIALPELSQLSQRRSCRFRKSAMSRNLDLRKSGLREDPEVQDCRPAPV